MGDYQIIFELLIAIIVVTLVFFFGRLISSILKTKRLEDFSISPKQNELNIEKKLWKIIHWVSNLLSKVLFMDDVAKKYEKYIKSGEESYKKPVDYVTVKIIFALLMGILYIFEVGLHSLNFNFILFLLAIILGFLFPNLLFILDDNKKRKFVSGDIVKSIIIMSNSFRAGRNVYQAIDDVVSRCDGALKEEFLHVKDDLDHGLTLGDAFERMYDRVHDKDIIYLANVLKLVNKNGVNINAAFENVEKTIVDKKRERDELNSIKFYNIIFRNVIIFIPVIFLLIIVILNKDYQMLLFGTSRGFKVLCLEIVTYVLYVLMINALVRRN